MRVKLGSDAAVVQARTVGMNDLLCVLQLICKLVSVSIRILSNCHRTGYVLKFAAARTFENSDLERLRFIAHVAIVNKRKVTVFAFD